MVGFEPMPALRASGCTNSINHLGWIRPMRKAMGELTNIPMMWWSCMCLIQIHVTVAVPSSGGISPSLGVSVLFHNTFQRVHQPGWSILTWDCLAFPRFFSSSSIAILISLVTSQLMSTMPFPICSTTLRVLNALHKDCTANSLLGSDWENCYVDKSITIATVKMVKSRAGWPGSFHCPIPKIGENNDHSE